jgi:hypothetical protein
VEVLLQVVRSEEEALLLGRGGLLQGRRGAAWGGRDQAESRPDSGAGGGGWSAPSSWDSGMCSISQQGNDWRDERYTGGCEVAFSQH